MPKHHAKFHQNWWCSFRDVTEQDTEGHSFIIIRILENKSVCNWYRIHLIIFSVKSTKYYIIAKVENTGY